MAQPIAAAFETDPMTGMGDRADDPALWVHPSDVSKSLILGTNKDEGLHVYDLSGAELQFLDVGQVNNVDVRGNVAAASNDEFNTITMFNINAETGEVMHTGNVQTGKAEPYGICMGEVDDTVLIIPTYEAGLGLVADVEGLSLWVGEGTDGYLVASAQAADRFVVYDRAAPHAVRGIFTVTASEDGSVDAVSHTDGLHVSSSALPGYPRGIVIVQDDANPTPEVDQNFKIADWAEIEAALGLTD